MDTEAVYLHTKEYYSVTQQMKSYHVITGVDFEILTKWNKSDEEKRE